MIKLLKKDEIDQLKNNDRAKEISEGLKLSRKVDSLRELVVNEEKALETFRSESVSAIHKEISTLEGQKDTLVSEIRTLRMEKEDGLKAIDMYRQELSIKEQDLTKKESEIEALQQQVEQELQNIQLNNKNASDEATRALNHTEEAQRIHELAIKEEEEAKLSLDLAHKTQEEAIVYKKTIENELIQRLEIIKEKETACELKEKENGEKEKEINIIKRQLADQRGTLERAIARYERTTRRK